MGINSTILTWFDELATAGHFAGVHSVLELGPQDHFFPTSQLEAIASRRIGNDATGVLASIADVTLPFSARQAAFYALFGAGHYKSVDSFDSRADLRCDLNTAQSIDDAVDLLVDCGTTEHVFNAGNVFVFTHNSLKVGGVALKVLPSFGDNTHGFFNIHPTCYFDVARVNNYEILDFRYIDNMSARSVDDGVGSLFAIEDMATELQSFAGCARLQQRITENFAASIARSQREGRLGDAHGTVDYCFVAMRKLADAPFRFPGQGVYLTEFPPENL